MIMKSSISQEIPINIVGSNTFGRYQKISVTETYNAFVSDKSLINFAGWKLVDQLNMGANGRAIWNSVKFASLISVIGNNIYATNTNLGSVQIGSLNTLIGIVFIAENNNNQLAFVDGTKTVYIYNYKTFEFTLNSVDFVANCITFQDGYFISSDGENNQWRLSSPNDGTQWPDDAPNVGALESKPDLTQAAFVLNRQLYIMGKTVCEPWYDQGQQLFPYQKNAYYNIDYGTIAASSVATGFDKMVWIGANEKAGATIMLTTGGQPEQISNDGINFKLASLSRPQDCYGFLFRQDGHVFYVATFYTDNISYAYDFNTKAFYTLTDHDLSAFPARAVASFNNSYYFVSYKDGNLYELNSKYGSANGNEIPRFRICDHIRLPDNSRFCLSNIFLTMETGQSQNDSIIGLSFSKDGGVSFGTIAMKQLPSYTDRQTTVRYWQLPSGNDLVPKFQWWGTDRIVINNAVASIYQ